MKNYLQNGHIVRVTTPAGGIASSDALIVGNIFGIAAYSSAEGDPVELSTTGVFQLPKASAAVLAGSRDRRSSADSNAEGDRRSRSPFADRYEGEAARLWLALADRRYVEGVPREGAYSRRGRPRDSPKSLGHSFRRPRW